MRIKFESSCIYVSTLDADCKQAAICRYIEALAITIVLHKNFSFEDVKYYSNTICRYSEFKVPVYCLSTVKI